MGEKIAGYTLLLVGLIVIVFSTYNIYQVFTKQIKPVQLFDLPAPQVDLGVLLSNSLPQEFAAFAPTKSSKQEIMAPEVINAPLNLTAHLFLMGFVASAGYKIASLGVMLIRPVVVKLKGIKEEKTENNYSGK